MFFGLATAKLQFKFWYAAQRESFEGSGFSNCSVMNLMNYDCTFLVHFQCLGLVLQQPRVSHDISLWQSVNWQLVSKFLISNLPVRLRCIAVHHCFLSIWHSIFFQRSFVSRNGLAALGVLFPILQTIVVRWRWLVFYRVPHETLSSWRDLQWLTNDLQYLLVHWSMIATISPQKPTAPTLHQPPWSCHSWKLRCLSPVTNL